MASPIESNTIKMHDDQIVVDSARKKTLAADMYVPTWIITNGSMCAVVAETIGTSIMIRAGLMSYIVPLGTLGPNSTTGEAARI